MRDLRIDGLGIRKLWIEVKGCIVETPDYFVMMEISATLLPWLNKPEGSDVI